LRPHCIAVANEYSVAASSFIGLVDCFAYPASAPIA
jgi:hypothetical protein